MRVLIDLSGFDTSYQGGVARYSLEISKALISKSPKNIEILASTDNSKFLSDFFSPETSIKAFETSCGITAKILYWFVYRVYPMPSLLRSAQKRHFKNVIGYCDDFGSLIYSPTTYLNFVPKYAKTLVSLHDCQEEKYPMYFSKTIRKYRKSNTVNTLANSTAIQVSSNFIRNELKTYFSNKQRDNFFVIPEGCNLNDFRPINKDSKKDAFQIFVPASFHPHKNQRVLLDALEKYKFSRPLKVIFSGHINSLSLSLQKEYEFSSGISVEYPGFLEDRDLKRLYVESDVVISTSLYESSSLPLLEAMASGTLVIASDIPSHVEMSETFSILLFESGSVNSLASTLYDAICLSDENYSLHISHNLRKIREFSWDVIAQRYLDFIQIIQERIKIPLNQKSSSGINFRIKNHRTP